MCSVKTGTKISSSPKALYIADNDFSKVCSEFV